MKELNSTSGTVSGTRQILNEDSQTVAKYIIELEKMIKQDKRLGVFVSILSVVSFIFCMANLIFYLKGIAEKEGPDFLEMIYCIWFFSIAATSYYIIERIKDDIARNKDAIMYIKFFQN